MLACQKEKELIVVRTGRGELSRSMKFTDVVEWIERVPVQHKGWRSVCYNGHRYQLLGGIRTDHFICLNNPIQGIDRT